MILRILTISAAVLLTLSAHSAPANKAAEKSVFPWQGKKLPLPPEGIDGREGQFRNDSWKEIARDLRVRDLRVYDWPAAYNQSALPAKQKNLVVERLRRMSYVVQKFDWDQVGGVPTDGFDAYRKGETLSTMWRNNGSHLLLYWGHQVPATPAQNRNDDLLWAVEGGETTRAQTLLQAGADPRASDYSGESVLNLATREQQAAIVKLLLDAQKASRGVAPDFSRLLPLAASNNDAVTVQIFLDAGATSTQIGAALRACVTFGAYEAARLLLPLAPNEDVDAGLVRASYFVRLSEVRQDPKMVELLLTRQPSPRALERALLAAATDDLYGVVPILLKAGANPDVRDEKGTPLLVSLAARGDLRTIKPLLSAGADPNETNAVGKTALEIAKINLAYASITDLTQRQKIVQLLEDATQTKSK